MMIDREKNNPGISNMNEESHEHESSKQQRRKRKSLKPRIELLVFVSILAAVVCSGFLLYDVLGMRLLENTRKSTHSYTTILLLVHIVGFYTAIVSNIYSTLARDTSFILLSIASLLSSVTTFILRFTLEIVFIEYRSAKK